MKVYKQLNNGIKIVEYAPSFAQAMCDMWAKSNDDWGGGAGIRTPQQVIAEHSGAANYNVYLALDGDAVVGYCSFSRYYYDADTTYIPLLNVQPDYQGKGIGKALVLQCIERTIELGYPRIDLYTWPGNTAAVPLYKKCGYLWEDRPNSTHLTNFIPTVLKLFPDFFAKADWYKDSTRVIETKPDGEKINEFECFGYSWAKDDEVLAVGFERSGKRIRLVETTDYKIEFMAENQKLAFGLDYDCTFTVENKTSKPLNVKITGVNEKNISFDFMLDTAAVPGRHEYKGRFHVGSITEPQDIWRVHPCLRADVVINGQVIPFGLGIESRFPLAIDIHSECDVSQIGISKDIYINISSALSNDATVKFTLAANHLLDFATTTHIIQVTKRGKASIKLPSVTRGIGYHQLLTTYEITLADGTSLSFEKPLHIVNHDLVSAFGFEKDTICGIANGPWYLELDKHDSNEASLYHILGVNPDEMNFEPPKFGKPYDDEFNLLKPNTRTYQNGAEMVLEAEFVSEKFPGMAIIQFITLTASGVVTRRYRIENRGSTTRSIMLNDPLWIPLGRDTHFSYNGKITTAKEGLVIDDAVYGMEDIDPQSWNENWIFEANIYNPRGICWPAAYIPAVKWGNYMSFEIEINDLAPGHTHDTLPIMVVYGMFTKANDFRNFAMGIYNRKPLDMEYPLEIKTNGYNPFMTGNNLNLELINNRSSVLEGEVRVDSPDKLFDPQSQTNTDESEATTGNTFELHVDPAYNKDIALARLTLDLALYQKSYTRALLIPSGEVTQHTDGDVHVVSNGRIIFKASAAYANALYSLTTGTGDTQVQWLESRYPNHEPYAWYNPFIGGIQTNPSGMNPHTAIKEKTTACFAQMPDNHGNLWQGICTTMTVTEFEELKGAVYESYYLTLPGLPVLCTFIRFVNNTGVFRESTECTTSFLRIAEELSDVRIDCINPEMRRHSQRAGEAWQGAWFKNMLKLSGNREESLYVFHGNKMATGSHNRVFSDNKVISTHINHEIGIAHGDSYTSRPTFYLITDKDLPDGALDDLERVVFE
ncbi:MAG: GNAT family N-acetyltransferase [Defluviitaleaceae bacterium]|nr:GNAT family N-acetyltransferase [Defluviitaleaceae bacterium]